MDVKHVAKLANLPLSDAQLQQLEAGLSSVIDLVGHIQKLDTANIEPTSQVTGLENVTRPDVVDMSRVLSQEQALSNAKKTDHGYFVVPAIFAEE